MNFQYDTEEIETIKQISIWYKLIDVMPNNISTDKFYS